MATRTGRCGIPRGGARHRILDLWPALPLRSRPGCRWLLSRLPKKCDVRVLAPPSICPLSS